MNNVHLIFNKEAREGEILIVADTNLFTRDNLASLAKKRRGLKFIINYIYKFKVF